MQLAALWNWTGNGLRFGLLVALVSAQTSVLAIPLASPLPPASIEVRCIGQWQPAVVDEDGRHPFGGLTDAAVLKAVGKGQPPTQPMFALRIGVGHPQQTVEAALDTTSGIIWLMEAGAQAFEGELQNVALYRSLGSRTARYVTAAELRPRVHLPLGALALKDAELVGRVIADSLEMAGLEITTQPLIIAEHVPDLVKTWHLGGVLGLGLRSEAIAPLVDTWRGAWMEPPALGNASNPAEAALQRQAASRQVPRPVVSIWPRLEAAVAPVFATSAAQLLVSTRPWAHLRLGLGTLEGTAWTPLLEDAAGWATEGHVSVDSPVAAVQAAGTGYSSRSKGRWAGRLLVDSTSPFLGVPARRFAGLVLALVPASVVQFCWFTRGASSGLQVQCKCSAVVETRGVTIEVAGRFLPLSPKELWQSDAAGQVCTALIRALQEPMETWHLGEPFLRRHAVTLDVPKGRLGFAPPPPAGLDTAVKEDLTTPSVRLQFPEDPPFFSVGGKTFATIFTNAGLGNFVSLLLVGLMAMLAFASSWGRPRLWRREARDANDWRPVAMYEAGSDEECIDALLQEEGDDSEEQLEWHR